MSSPSRDVLALQDDVERRARDAGLPVPEIRYEVVDHRELNEIAAYGGFPVRYPHWRFGMEYDRLIKGHAYGLQRIYELVVNTEPVVAYLLRQNTAVETKLVMAHVCGHADFFRNNAWFAHTDRNMMDVMASHGARMRTLADRHGLDAVESFVDKVLSLDNLVDAGAMARAVGRPGNAPPLDGGEAPAADVLGHLLLHAPLAGWQQEVLAILRDEAYYFLPQVLTKVMNEGWATFWHSRLMTGSLLRDAEVVDYAESHAGALGGEGFNPYKLGVELYLDILERHDGDLAKLFEVRAVHDDLTFVDNHLDEPFALGHGLGATGPECDEVRQRLLSMLTNGGQPVIRLVDGDGPDLELVHCWSGAELELGQAEETLRSLAVLWGAPVRLHARLENRAVLVTCDDGQVEREYGEAIEDPPPADEAA